MANVKAPLTVAQESSVTIEACLKSCKEDEKCTNVSFGKGKDEVNKCGLYQSTEPMVGEGEEGDTNRCFLKTAHEINDAYFKQVANMEMADIVEDEASS